MKKKSLKELIDEKQKNMTSDEKRAAKTINEKAKQYNNMSREQLLGEIIKKKKTSKSIDNKSLNEFEKYILPMLDANQKNKLNEIMNHLKD